ncbi:MAG: DnaJ domain-containing protein [Thermostichus sp. DG_1_6_bins_120]
MARQFHPDVAGEGSRERFQQIRKAYQVLSDPEQRGQYDAQRQSLPQVLLQVLAGRVVLWCARDPLQRTNLT